MVTSTYGRQPLCDVLHERRWQIKRFAEEHGLSYNHLYNVATGRVAASRELQDLLPTLLDLPPDSLFTEKSMRNGNHSEIALLGELR